MAKEISWHYNNTVELVHETGRHTYHANGERVAGVTGILGVIAKDFMAPWAAKEAVRYLGYYDKKTWTPDGYIPVPEEEQAVERKRMLSIFERTKTMTSEEYWQFLFEAKGAHVRKRDLAADVGTMVHEHIEKLIQGSFGLSKGILPDLPLPEIPQVRNGVLAFLSWVKKNDVLFVLSEAKVYSKTWNIAGTLDFTARIKGKLFMGDIKTSNFFDPLMFWQVSAYQMMRTEEFPKEKYLGQLILRCGKEGELEEHYSLDYASDAFAFISLISASKRIAELKAVSKP